jgi:hypothetical protein
LLILHDAVVLLIHEQSPAPPLARSGTLDNGNGTSEDSPRMSSPENPADRLWNQYGTLFHRFDDLTLARWLVQTLGHLNGGTWRYSHPLVGAYKLAAQAGHQRQIWLKRLVDLPGSFTVAGCCRAPLFPLVTRDLVESGLICMHCNETAVPFTELPGAVQRALKSWAREYAEIHRIAHLEGKEREALGNFDDALDEAAERAVLSLRNAAADLFPKLLELYSAVVWEDHDECLEVRPEDLVADS